MKALIVVIVISILSLKIVLQENAYKTQELRVDLLKDQIEDYADQIDSLRQSKTYEDGLRDGILNSKSAEYTRGYHAALKDGNPFSSIIISQE